MMNKIQEERYNRHLILREIGSEGQQKLLNAKVLVVGAGGLGAPILQYLTAAGVGTIGIMDADTVSLSNLQRQILYKENQVGKPKTLMAVEALKGLNSDVKFVDYPYKLTVENAENIIGSYDIVIGATDNFVSRKIIDAETAKQQKPYIHGSIGEFEGQISVFNYKGGSSYAELFPETPNESSLPLGVMGVLPGIIGSMQACEAIKIIIEQGNVLSGKLLIYNALSLSVIILDL